MSVSTTVDIPLSSPPPFPLKQGIEAYVPKKWGRERFSLPQFNALRPSERTLDDQAIR